MVGHEISQETLKTCKMRNTNYSTRNLVRNSEKCEIREIQQDPDFGEKTEKRGK